MKYIKSILTITLSVFLLVACGKKSDNKVSELGDKANQTVQGQASQVQTQFVSGVQKNLDQMEDGMDEVKEGIDKKEGEEKASLQDEWKKLKTQKEELETMIQKVKNNQVDDWGQLKTDIQDQWTSVKGTYQNLRDQLNLS